MENEMTTRVVVADQAEARFYDIEAVGGTLSCVGQLSDPDAHLHDRDLKSDRPGRVFDHAPTGMHRRGAVAHHSTGGEETPRRHEALAFASRIAQSLESARNAHEFDRLVVIAGPRFMGMLRASMSKPLNELIVVEVLKDLMHENEEAIRTYLPVTVVSARAHLPA
jgi:protein required for attachment to host cells